MPVPRIVAFAETAPWGTVTLGVSTATCDGSLDATAMVRPPLGAGVGAIEIGSDTVCPGPAVSAAGMLITFGVPPIDSVPSLNPGAFARIVAVPAATPFTITSPLLLPAGISTLAGGPIVSTAVSSLDTVTRMPPAGAGGVSVTARCSDDPTPTSDVPTSARPIVPGRTLIDTVSGAPATVPSRTINCAT